MVAKTSDIYEAQAKVVKAMAHPTRLFIVDMLAEKERTVGELTEMIGADMSTVSKHLSVLKAVGILSDRKSNNLVYYRLTLPCAMSFFKCVESIMKASAEKQMELARKGTGNRG